MLNSWLLMDIRVKGKFKINAVEQSLVFPEFSDDIIQDIGVAHRVKHRCGVVHKLASIGAVEYTDGTGLANMQRVCQHLDNPCNLSM